MKTLIFDIETDGLLDTVSKVWCAWTYHVELEIWTGYGPSEIQTLLSDMLDSDILVGHNILGYDLKVLKQLHDFDWESHEIQDTLVMSRVAYPDIARTHDFNNFKSGDFPGKLIGSHALKAWGYRLGVLKGEFSEETDWQEYSSEMFEYCRQDVEVTLSLWKFTKDKITPQSMSLEHKTFRIIDQQSDRGFYFDQTKARQLYIQMKFQKSSIILDLSDKFRDVLVPGKEFIPKRDNKRLGYTKGEAMQKIRWVPFNPTSRQHVAKWLIQEYGWEPEEYTPAGQPKLSETILESLDYPEAKALLEYFTLVKRMGQLGDGNNGWLKLVDSDSRIRGRINTNGCVTGRMTHSKPNMAQVPRAPKPYGKECRELFKASPGFKLVGFDASGLELRCLAHYIIPRGGADYAQEIVSGDVHQLNADFLKIDRNTAKTFIYAFIYGAQGPKLASILAVSEQEGWAIRRRFLRKIPSLGLLLNQVQAKVKAVNHLKGLDGRFLPIRRPGAALNTLLQSAGAVVMKQTLINLRNLLGDTRCFFVGNIHDEIQMECHEDDLNIVREACLESIKKAGQDLELKVPLEGEVKIGDNWNETH